MVSLRNNRLHTPDGVSDFLGGECERKRAAERAIAGVFAAYGYREAQSPTFEYFDVYGSGGTADERVFRFIDRDGAVLALRPDMTPACLRIAATRYAAADAPFRLSYIAETFRRGEDYHGKRREITQAGAELIGATGESAFAEMITVSVESLISAGLTDFRLDMGSARFFRALLAELGLDGERGRELQSYILSGDFVAAGNLTESIDAPSGPKQLMRSLPLFIGGSEALERAAALVTGSEAMAALAALSETKRRVDLYGMGKYVGFDLSMIGALDYYTGIIWNAYAPGAAAAVLFGGQYDGLSARFGANYPAVGFAINVNTLLDSLGAAPSVADVLLVAADADCADEAILAAKELRRGGARAQLSLIGWGAEKNADYARRQGLRGLVYIRPGLAEVTDFAAGTRETKKTRVENGKWTII
jgi:ATP phosphoribosyltransferase regulatory subunit